MDHRDSLQLHASFTLGTEVDIAVLNIRIHVYVTFDMKMSSEESRPQADIRGMLDALKETRMISGTGAFGDGVHVDGEQAGGATTRRVVRHIKSGRFSPRKRWIWMTLLYTRTD